MQEITIIEELDVKKSIEELYAIFKDKPYSIILDSSLNTNDLGKYSVILYDPFLVFTSKGENIQIIKEGKTEEIQGDPFECLRVLLDKYKVREVESEVPFTGGCAGYFSYDLINIIEKIPLKPVEENGIPDIVLGFYNNIITIDHSCKKTYVSLTSAGISPCADFDVLIKKVDSLKYLINAEGKTVEPDFGCIKFKEESAIKSDFTKDEYCRAVENVKERIKNGDIFQANISQRFNVRIGKKPYEIFEKLRKINPAPFSAYLNFDELNVISSSPERFLRIKNRIIETRPIKGTRPRGKTLQDDEELRKELFNSEKDRAELTMIIDVHRNDLGKVSKIGSVNVDKMFTIEEYATVFHLVSIIYGELKDDVDVIDCIKAAFPGGSITGAPKLKAVEIIDGIEPVKRGVYTGSIGYIGFDGYTDLNVAIRTIIQKEDMACYNVGGGIVWDSLPEKEYQETLDKGIALMKALTSD